MNQSAAHTKLVREALEALALKGYCAWPVATGVWFEKGVNGEKGRAHKYGKVGAADIAAIIPRLLLTSNENSLRQITIGQHCEFEAKTGKAVQNKNQKLHQKFVVERNGGLYIVFRSVDELLEKIKIYKL